MITVLVIEEEAAYQKILKDSFEKEKFKVVLASEVRQAFDEITIKRPDIILLDIMLPGGMNGFDFLEQLKANAKISDIPVIIITNLSSEEKVAKEVGAVSYFVKSETTIEQIINKVKEVLKYERN